MFNGFARKAIIHLYCSLPLGHFSLRQFDGETCLKSRKLKLTCIQKKSKSGQ